MKKIVAAPEAKRLIDEGDWVAFTDPQPHIVVGGLIQRFIKYARIFENGTPHDYCRSSDEIPHEQARKQVALE